MTAIQITDLYKLKSFSQPFGTPDRTFFVQTQMNKEKNDYQTNILAIEENGTVQPYTNGGKNLQPMVVGNSLYYRHQDNQGHYQLMKMPVDGGVATPVTKENGSVDDLRFSPDGTLAFLKVTLSPEKDEEKDQGLTPRHLTKVQNKADGIGWLPTENVYELKSFDSETGETKLIKSFSHDFHLQDVSADTQEVAYLAAEHPDWTDKFDTSQAVYAHNRQTDQTTWVTASIPNGVFTDAAFSPDQSRMAIIGSDYHAYSATVNQLYVYDTKSNELTKPAQDEQVNVGYGNPIADDWTQNPSHVSGFWVDNDTYLYTAVHHGHSQLYRYHAQENTTEKVHEADRHIVDFAMIDNQNIVFVHSTAEKAGEIRALNIETKAERVLANPNADYESTHQYAPTEFFYYKTADGKAEVQGWFTKAQTNNDTAPLILYIHGGPHAAFANTFFQEFQALAGEGFNVLYVNPRGSTSYGEDFATDVMGHYGENDYADVMTAVDYALTHFKGINPDKVFVAGGSYGGFLSTWIIGHTDRFQAAIVQRPAIDWFNLYHNSDIGVPFVTMELGADLYEDKAHQLYWEKSPLAYADKITTPVRIQHGEADRRCPPSQSEALFTAIKRTGTECDYIRYPKSFHGFSRNGKPSLRVQRMQDIVDWFKRF